MLCLTGLAHSQLPWVWGCITLACSYITRRYHSGRLSCKLGPPVFPEHLLEV